MLKHRVIPILLCRESQLVKGVGFDSWRPIGIPLPAARVHEMRQVDELIVLDIGATPNGAGPNFDMIAAIAEQCFMPLTVGGGVRTVSDIRTLLAVGADKITINTQAMNEPSLISEAAEKFGSQCIVVSIDAWRHDGGSYEVYTHCGKVPAECSHVEWAQEVERRGAGEILLNSINKDGTMEGYDLELVRSVSRAVSIPVVACGGAGCAEDFVFAARAGAAATAAAAVFQFTDQTPMTAKQVLSVSGISVRLPI